MDEAYYLIKIINALEDGSKTIKELSEITGIEKNNLKRFFAMDLKNGGNLLNFWNIELYDEDGNNIYFADSFLEDDDVFPDTEYYMEFLKDDVEVLIFNDVASYEPIGQLSEKERFLLFEILSLSNSERLNSIKEKIFASQKEYYDKLNKLSERRIIKQYISLNAFDKGIIVELYKAMDNKNRIILELKSGKKMSIIPQRILYEDDAARWYLEAVRKGRCFIIDLDNITKIYNEKCIKKQTMDEIYTSFGIGKRITYVKLRVYNEKNAKERAIRFLLRKNIKEQKSFDYYIEIKAKVSDIAVFKRWLREMGPSVVLLEPKWLRKQIIDSLYCWRRIFEEGGN